VQVHLILGIGYFESGIDPNHEGVMGDVAASPNDPVFINHHTMIDCILEGWLLNHDNAMYPNPEGDNVTLIHKGHRRDDYIVPFFPLKKHRDVFMTADNFGYFCDIDFTEPPNTENTENPGNRGGPPRSAAIPLFNSTGSLVLLFSSLFFYFLM
jgi:hypothetical protein